MYKLFEKAIHLSEIAAVEKYRVVEYKVPPAHGMAEDADGTGTGLSYVSKVRGGFWNEKYDVQLNMQRICRKDETNQQLKVFWC